MKKVGQSSDIALKVDHISKSFHLPTEKANGIKQAFINRMRGVRGYKKQHVLKDISFEVKKGDFFGIVGRNGSGKSTLLKLISQIYTPDSGKITVNGSLVPFIELGVGFNPELTGRENVYLNGAMLGFSRDEIDVMYDEIVEFAELGEFMDQKLKNYSSGMQVRLAFSVAIKAQGDILVLDEVLAVGDEAFQEKCERFFKEAKNQGKTIILVTHSMKAVQEYCTRAMVVDAGQILEIGDPEEAAATYSQLNVSALNNKPKVKNKRCNVKVENVSTYNAAREACNYFKPNEKVIVRATVRPIGPLDNVEVGFRLYAPGLPSLVGVNTKVKKVELALSQGKQEQLQWEFPAIFNSGIYSVGIKVYNRKTQEIYLKDTDVYQFQINGWDDPYHMTQIETKLTKVD